ncbi:MAG: two-component system sensor histidine kinase NtrB [Desulfomonilaceae bacterium]
MSRIKPLSVRDDKIPDKALSAEQMLSYARDLAEVLHAERARRQALEAANDKLEKEISEREKAQKQLAESEKKYRTLFEESRDAIYISDSKGTFIDVNPSFLELFACTKAEVLGRAPGNFVNPLIWHKFQREVEKRGSVKDHAMQLHKYDGTVMECLITATLRRAEDGSILGRQGIVRDVTEHKLSQEVLQHAKKMDALSNLAGGIAHEVRNPLAISSSAAQLLMDDDVPEAFRKDCARKIVSGIQRASVIIENLLALARPLTDFEMTALNLVSLVRQSEKSIVNQARDQGVELIFTFHHEPLIVNGNASLLVQAIMNLFMNAFAAMKLDGGTLTACVERNGANALIIVSDTGHGILDEHLDKVFDPFFSKSTEGKGAGLGLSTSYSIVKQHSGNIRVSSTPGKGSTFTVTLPLA